MADGLTSDFSELDQLAIELGVVAATAGPLIAAAVKVTSLKVKRDWQEPLKGSKTLPTLPYAITFDIDTVFGQIIKSEIGFDKNRNQGPLGNVSEYGTPTITGRGYGIEALHKNQDDFEKGLDIALRQAEAIVFRNSSFGRITQNVILGSE